MAAQTSDQAVISFKVPRAVAGNTTSIAAQYARAKALKSTSQSEINSEAPAADHAGIAKDPKNEIKIINEKARESFIHEWNWLAGFFLWLMIIHGCGLYFFSQGYLLTRLVLPQKSECSSPPIALPQSFKGVSTYGAGCWHPKSFEKAIIIVIDALRYDFTVPNHKESEAAYFNALTVMYETVVREPQNAFLLPFIADPPTTTMQRLKGLTTGTLPTFVDVGSSFTGVVIEEDNLLLQLKDAGKKIVHLGDDTWTALFPQVFEEKISKAYDSFNVWDLHTVDNGITEHIMPLLQNDKKKEWDVIIAHYLGVDHAGHRYGPNHPAMASKLHQMDAILRNVTSVIDDKTLLVVMGDHGMDEKGDHGGESDDEIQAALWMYSKKGMFGRTSAGQLLPPQTAKERHVNQIDLVPTIALLLGIPIPFNNLGQPIQEAFIGKRGNDWGTLATVARITAAGTKRYQTAYNLARGMNDTLIGQNLDKLWLLAEQAFVRGGKQKNREVYAAFSAFSNETLTFCRSIWAQFDVTRMWLGIGVMALGMLVLLLFVNGNFRGHSVDSDPKLNCIAAEPKLESQNRDHTFMTSQTSSKQVVQGTIISSLIGLVLGAVTLRFDIRGSVMDKALFTLVVSGTLGALHQTVRFRWMAISNYFPTTIWSWLSVIFTLSQAFGFASNSYTIWEDSILLLFISTFGIVSMISSLRIEKASNRALGVYHSLVFTLLGWVASYSKLCREEQMPYCRSTYYASSTTSTSASWQLLLPFIAAIILPSIIKTFYQGSLSYEGLAPLWIGWAFRIGLICNAVFWTLDAADDGKWLPSLDPMLFKQIRVVIAQTIFAVVLGAGLAAFVYAPPCVSIQISEKPASSTETVGKSGSTMTILGFANMHGTRYFLLVLNLLVCILLLQKPMGAGALALMIWQVLALAEILDLNSLTSSPVGPVMLALLGSFYFFKTGHQTTPSSIQWESAFIPLHTVRYLFSPLLIVLNSFGAQALSALAVPGLVLWKQKPCAKHLTRSVLCALAWHISYYSIISLMTSIWAAWLRRHLMLYRIFSPKFITSALVLLLVDIVVLLALVGFRANRLSIGSTFGWISG
ncbi:Bgt-5314 [Blumeria graminis f. sp. tritici]|uniref:Bgt-5314 n=2 Tax=Blumeria graminis f. sp. tritici TaxID=62690 RepID=A0A9X9MFE1_BLUGR|nr:hypothetical protein BGT96224_5314 [Blumeria graminis f. sp. tritici 96224]VDB84299.1 Bgt-5314 [Blumeria graminis f. sp. tritici]